MRTLVVGIPLPHVSFDNFSFLSAPSLFDYPSMIVDTAAVSRAVEEVVEGSGQHSSADGLPVVNGPAGPSAVSLADLLGQREQEARRFLERGGVLAAFAYPDVPHLRVEGLSGWHRYGWLPAPPGFSYRQHLRSGFGSLGVRLEDSRHPFAPYVDAFGPRLAYRAHVAEDAPGFPDYTRVFARSPGGAAVGVELQVAAGRLALLPPLHRFDRTTERASLGQTLFDCLERCRQEKPARPAEWAGKEAS